MGNKIWENNMIKVPPYVSVMMGFQPSALELIVQTEVGHSAPVLLELLFTVKLKKTTKKEN